MSTQFKNIRTQSSAIRAWGDDEGFVVVELQISRGNEKKEESMAGSYESSVHISDAYSLREGEWLAEFGTIKSMTGLSNKQIPDILQRLKELGKLGATKAESQWENICMLNGKLFFTEDLKNEKPKKIVVEGIPFTDIAEKKERIDLPQDTEEKTEEDQEFDEWLDDIIGIISEIADATPEQLQKLGQSLNLIGKELEDSGLDEEVDSLVETIESDEEDEMIEQCIQEIKNGNEPLINFFTGLEDKADSKPEQKQGDNKLSQEDIKENQKEVIETPVKPNESPIANQIMQEAAEKISKTWAVNEQQRHTDAIVEMVQKMQLMSTEEIEKLWDMWTRRQERLANQGKPVIIPKKKSEPESTLSDNDWKEIDESWEKDEKKYWKELKELGKKSEPVTKTWGPNKKIYSKGEEKMSDQEIAKGRKRHDDFLEHIFQEVTMREPMDWLETQKIWDDMCKQWHKQCGARRMLQRREQQDRATRRIHDILPSKFWKMMDPRNPEFWD